MKKDYLNLPQGLFHSMQETFVNIADAGLGAWGILPAAFAPVPLLQNEQERRHCAACETGCANRQ